MISIEKRNNIKLDTIYNTNCYEFIKTLPDKCVDLVYTDIPYEMASFSLSGIYKTRAISIEMKKHKQKLLDGIDYSILDDLCRICKRIYIYIYGLIKHKYPIY